MKFAFYEKALNLFKATQETQIQKGLQKYPEPFNPHSWTPEELLNHALEETVDLTHYLVGLKDLLDVKDKEIERLNSLLKEENRRVESYKKHWSLAMDKLSTSLPKKSPFEEQYAKYFDPDDQH